MHPHSLTIEDWFDNDIAEAIKIKEKEKYFKKIKKSNLQVV